MGRIVTDKAVAEIKKLLKSPLLIIGTKDTIDNLKQGAVGKVFMSSNCPETVKKDIGYYSKLAKAEVVELKQANDELGVICKKPFSISVLSLKKGAT